MFVEDLSHFFPDFGVPVTLGGTAVVGIFDNGYDAMGMGRVGMASTQPMLTLPTASVPSGVVGQAATVNATAYTVVAAEPDGTGITRLMLEASA